MLVCKPSIILLICQILGQSDPCNKELSCLCLPLKKQVLWSFPPADILEAATRGVLCKCLGRPYPFKFLKAVRPVTLFKKRLWHRCFPANLAKFPRRPFFTEHLWWLLLISQHDVKLATHWSLLETKSYHCGKSLPTTCRLWKIDVF